MKVTYELLICPISECQADLELVQVYRGIRRMDVLQNGDVFDTISDLPLGIESTWLECPECGAKYVPVGQREQIQLDISGLGPITFEREV